jgi:hypothetical protein
VGIYYDAWHFNAGYRGYRKDIQTVVNPFARTIRARWK